MKTITILTPANIEIEYRLAGAGSRLAAFTVDLIIQLILCAAFGFVILYGIYGYRFNTLATVEGFALALLIISWNIIYFCYFIICEMTTNGQSVGKKLFGLRVIRDNGEPVELSQSMTRNMFRAVLDIFYIGLFFILFSPNHKRVGDIVAGTVVICEHYESIPLLPDYTPNISGYEELRHLQLTANEKNLLSIYFARKVYLSDDAGEQIRKQWADHFSKKWRIDPLMIDDELLKGLLTINEER